MCVTNDRLGATGRWAEFDGHSARGNGRRDLDYLHETVVWFMPGDIPNRIALTRLGYKDTIRFSDARMAKNETRVPAVDPIGLANRAGERPSMAQPPDVACTTA